MQFLQIHPTTTLVSLASQVGSRNVSEILNVSGVQRTQNIGAAVAKRDADAIAFATIPGVPDINNLDVPSNGRKADMLNGFSSDSDIFEKAALMSDTGWVVMNETGSFPSMLRIPETLSIPNSVNTIGNGEPVNRGVFDLAISQMSSTGVVSPTIFNDYTISRNSNVIDLGLTGRKTQWFNIPWGKITLYSSLSGESIDFPCYPDKISDGVQANYTDMGELLYQYEPWKVYSSSGPRTNTYQFHMHRDMWSGDHNDGSCNKLVRFCEANCYPRYQGSIVSTSTVKLLIEGKVHISGIVTEVKTEWSGPLGDDGFYLECTLSISITEIAEQPLNYDTVKERGIIG